MSENTTPTVPTPEGQMRTRDRDELAEVLAAHATVKRVAEPRNNADRNLGRTRYEMRCTCGERLTWDQRDGEAHRAHVADVLAQRDRRVAAEAVLEFVAWIARARAHNGSESQYGQSLYNECINAALPVWAAEWMADRVEAGDQ